VSEHVLRKGQFGPIFDGDQFPAIPGGTPEVWSSFPMRYAMRRQSFETYQPASSTAPPPPGGTAPQQQQPQQPSGVPQGPGDTPVF
jgi:hypothetical protein